MTLDVLRSLGQASEGMRSKSFREFAAPGAPELHFVITVCDNAASEACPLWPGRPVSAHWGVPDPAVFEGSEVEKLAVFRDTYVALEARVKALVRLDLAALDPESLAERLRAIGAEEPLR